MKSPSFMSQFGYLFILIVLVGGKHWFEPSNEAKKILATKIRDKLSFPINIVSVGEFEEYESDKICEC